MPRTHPSPRLVLCVLGGGRSSRFGRSKLGIHINGEPVLAWQARRLAAALRPRPALWLSVAPGADVPPGADVYRRRIADAEAFAGPLAGIAAVLAAAMQDDTVAFVPADMLLLEASHVARLVGVLHQQTGTAVVMNRWANGPRRGAVEPLPSAWRVSAGRQLLKEAVAKGVRGPSALADWPGVLCLDLRWPGDAAGWSSVNHRRDLGAVRRRLPGNMVTVE